MQAYYTVLLQYKRGLRKDLGWGEGHSGINWLGLETSGRVCLPSTLPPHHPMGWRGGVSIGRGLSSVLGLSVPTPPVPPFRGQGPAPLCGNTVNSRGPGTRPFPHGSPSTWGGRGRRSKSKGSRCWSLSFIFGDGGREESEAGACLRSPPGPLVADGMGQGTRIGARAKGRGVGWL